MGTWIKQVHDNESVTVKLIILCDEYNNNKMVYTNMTELLFDLTSSFGASPGTNAYGPGWPLIQKDLPDSASLVLGLGGCVTTTWPNF